MITCNDVPIYEFRYYYSRLFCCSWSGVVLSIYVRYSLYSSYIALVARLFENFEWNFCHAYCSSFSQRCDSIWCVFSCFFFTSIISLKFLLRETMKLLVRRTLKKAIVQKPERNAQRNLDETGLFCRRRIKKENKCWECHDKREKITPLNVSLMQRSK